MILGFDFGMKYIGVATGQAVTKTASPLTCLRATDGIPNWAEVAELINTWQPQMLVVGLPLNMDGSEQDITACARRFANRLQHKYRIPVHLADERLSTWEAKQGKPARDFAEVNAAAAAVILQEWLNNAGKNA